MSNKSLLSVRTRCSGSSILSVCRVLLLAMLLLPTIHGVSSARQRPKVGLVLGGGGAKGAAEIGVLKYIEKSGVPIDYIVGTSIGSIVGGLYSCGLKADELDSLFCSQQWLDLFTGRQTDLRAKSLSEKDGTNYLFGFPVGNKNEGELSYGHGLLRGDSIYNFLNRLTQRPDSISYDKLPIPFRCVAVDANTFTEQVFSSGVLAESMRASMSIPVVFKPVAKDSLLYVDGGMINNLPVDVCRAMGADIIIAVDLVQNHHDNDVVTALSDDKIKRILQYPRLLKLLAWVKYRPDLVKYQENRKNVDIYINPDLKGLKASSFKRSKIIKMIKAGEKAGEDALPQLVALRKKLKVKSSKKRQK